MKIQCNACGAVEAAVLCCADEAALCRACDERVHAANKLAGKHQRVPLLSDGAGGGGASSSRGVPKCDICQCPVGLQRRYFISVPLVLACSTTAHA
ncbi:hypothetical protein ZIOFF_010000 [Zingiber officinale]|uniref:B box-type domain-containing protein n=1 Tax=Zingiber officinale TaxID=94328 RepID=A0A8J5LJR8_ZINOF|nr:hypothetical protein ZIOFF_010000 [Zingiber officinale]